jgi:hypothetical protein
MNTAFALDSYDYISSASPSKRENQYFTEIESMDGKAISADSIFFNIANSTVAGKIENLGTWLTNYFLPPISFSSTSSISYSEGHAATLTPLNEAAVLNIFRNNGIELINSEKIAGFIPCNLDLVTYILEASEVIPKFFNSSKIKLVLIEDSETDFSGGTIFLKIASTIRDREINLKILSRLTREWLLPRVGVDIVRFNIDIENIE